MKNEIFALCATVYSMLFGNCSHQLSRDYLLRHPDILQREIIHCHSEEEKTEAIAQRCEIVMSTADEFMKLISEQQHDPEGFGVRVMQAQSACVQAKQRYAEALRHMTALKRVRVSGEDMAKAEESVRQTHADYVQKRRAVEVLYAVIGVSSPE